MPHEFNRYGSLQWRALRGRELAKFGHKVGIIASKFIAPFRKGGKNDNNDAEAICEAAARSTIWFVPVKTTGNKRNSACSVFNNV